MLRFHLTPEDLGRITIAGPDPMSELVLSAWSLARGHLPASVRRETLRHIMPAAAPLLQLTSRPLWCPDFLMPGAGADFATSLDMVLDTPTRQVRSELAPLARSVPWTREPRSVRAALRTALPAYYRDVFARYRDVAAAAVSADRAVRARALLDGGVDQLLSTLHPGITWTPPVLAVQCVQDVDSYVDGRGIRLTPVYFVLVPTIRECDGEPLGIVYPARADPPPARGADALAPLVGRTRAAVLGAVAGSGLTTSQIARYLAISPASASEHASVLRGAGLVTSRRAGNAVVHALTPLGAGLLREGG